jgi:hypothetical protein
MELDPMLLLVEIVVLVLMLAILAQAVQEMQLGNLSGELV